MTLRSRALVLLPFAALLFVAGGARSMEREEIAGDEDAARVHFRAGQGEYGAGHFESALERFVLAYKAWAHPAFLFNIGQCFRQLDEHEAAIFFFRAYLEGVPDAGNIDAVNVLIEESLAVLKLEGREPTYEPPTELAELLRLETGESEELIVVAAPPEAVRYQDTLIVETKRAPPIYKRWWFWTIVGVAATGAAVGAGLAAGGDGLPKTSLGEIDLTGK